MVGDKKRREETWLPEGIDPMPGVPEVRVLDEDGKEVMRGYYFRHVNRQVAPLGCDRLRPEDVDHCVAYDGFADWNMPQPAKMAKITPPHRIEVLGGIDRDALLALADENRRAERTCRMQFDDRECRYRCSRCGCLGETYRSTDGKWYAPEYCSSCGAKVVSE